jgi:MerR family transcriptional regulator, light-induced transcriptional regulator
LIGYIDHWLTIDILKKYIFFYFTLHLVASYSIKDLELLTGVKAHTLRIWEQRYQLLEPQRTETNIRYYSDEQAKKILKVTILYNQGVKISRIASMNETKINESIMDHELSTNHNHAYIEKMTIAMIELNDELFISTFEQCIAEYGFKETVIKIIYPFLEKLGIMWTVGDVQPAQEHFISSLIRQKLIARIDKVYDTTSRPHKRVIMFTPEGDLHELGLLFYSYVLQESGFQVIYLGQSVPLEDVLSVSKSYSCEVFVTSVINPGIVEEYKENVKALFKKYPKAKLYMGGSQKDHFTALHKSVHKINSPEELLDFLA